MSAHVERDDAAADVAVAKRVEAMLRHEGLNLKGSSDASAWASPSEFWQDASYRKTWYTKAIAYWENDAEVPATVDGVLGGFAVLDAPDVRASRRFLAQAREAVGQSGGFAAADVGDRARIKTSWRISQHDRPHAGRRGRRPRDEARAAAGRCVDGGRPRAGADSQGRGF